MCIITAPSRQIHRIIIIQILTIITHTFHCQNPLPPHISLSESPPSPTQFTVRITSLPHRVHYQNLLPLIPQFSQNPLPLPHSSVRIPSLSHTYQSESLPSPPQFSQNPLPSHRVQCQNPLPPPQFSQNPLPPHSSVRIPSRQWGIFIRFVISELHQKTSKQKHHVNIEVSHLITQH